MKYIVERREKQFIRSAFGMYLAPAVLESVLKSPEKLKLGGEKRTITVLFSDIEQFTSFTEKLPSEVVVTMLNEYFTEMVGCIAKTNGTLDKFVGDAILAEWNAPADQPEHAVYACETALLMLSSLDGLRQRWLNENKPPMNIRIGINTGEMIVGNVGADNIFDYTAIGNEVNTAARFEALNKDFGTRVILSGSTYADLERHRPGEFIVRTLTKVVVKGRTTSVMVYELVGKRSAMSAEKIEMVNTFNGGMDHFMERRFTEARRSFENVLEQAPNEKPAEKYLILCREYERVPPEAGWTGEYVQKSK
jgi:adenylate cyclase